MPSALNNPEPAALETSIFLLAALDPDASTAALGDHLLAHARPVPWSVRSAVAHQQAKAGEHEAAWQALDQYFESAMLEAPAGCASTLFAASYVLDAALRSGEAPARWEVRHLRRQQRRGDDGTRGRGDDGGDSVLNPAMDWEG